MPLGYDEGMRRRFQFRLRTLFVVTTLAAILSRTLPPYVERYIESMRFDSMDQSESLTYILISGPRPSSQASIKPRSLVVEMYEAFGQPLPPAESP